MDLGLMDALIWLERGGDPWASAQLAAVRLHVDNAFRQANFATHLNACSDKLAPRRI